MKQEMMGWQWQQLDHMQIICNSLYTDNMAAHHHSSFHRPDANTQATVSKHWRQTTMSTNKHTRILVLVPSYLSCWLFWQVHRSKPTTVVMNLNLKMLTVWRHAVPRQPIWTIMVAAKLDHSQ